MGGGEVLGVADLKTVMVKLRDGHGVEQIKIAIVAADGSVYFLDDKNIMKPAQNWVKSGVLQKLGRVA